ncbi:MAG: protein NosL [Pseudomonadota bacterium]
MRSAMRGSTLRHVLVLVLALVLAACTSDPPTGPVEIRYGRDTCDLCHMIISDPRFASQIRGGPGHKAYKFDDIGDALLFLARQPWKDDANVEIWVMDVDTGKTWLDARKAFYLPGMASPMAHGFGAVPDQRPGTVPFEEMRSRAAKRAARAYCLPGSTEGTRSE